MSDTAAPFRVFGDTPEVLQLAERIAAAGFPVATDGDTESIGIVTQPDTSTHPTGLFVVCLPGPQDALRWLEAGALDVWLPDELLSHRFPLVLARTLRLAKAAQDKQALFWHRQACSRVGTMVAAHDTDLRCRLAYNIGSPGESAIHLGNTDAEVYPPKLAELLASLRRQVLESEQPVHTLVDASEASPDLTVEWWCHPVYNDGRCVGVVSTGIDRTLALRADQTSHQERELYKALFYNASTAMIVSAPDDNGSLIIQAANNAAARILGSSRQNLLNTPLSQWIQAIDLITVQQLLDGPEGTSFRKVPLRLVASRHQPTLIHAIARRINGLPQRVIALEFQECAEQSLQDNLALIGRDRLLQIIDAMPVLLLATDANGQIVFWNKQFERLSGVSPQAFRTIAPTLGLSDLHHLPDGQPYEQSMPTASGQEHIISWQKVSAEAPIAGWHSWAVGIDVTDWRRTEAALRDSEERLELALDTGGLSVWDWQMTDDLFIAEDIWRWLGVDMPRQPHSMQMLTDRVHPDDLGAFQEGLRRHLLGATPEWHAESRIAFADGTDHWCAIHGRVTETNADHLPVRMVGVISDITSRRQSEEALTRSDQMAAVGTLAAGVAHEFNNINAGAMGFLSLLLQRKDLPEPVIERLNRIQSLLRRASDITNGLLVYTRLESNNRQVCMMSDIIEDVLRLVAPECRSQGIEVIVNKTEERDPVCVDRSQISQVVLNLTINAIHAMLGQQERKLTITIASTGSVVQTQFMDTGHGISAEHLSRVFRPFFTTKGEKASGMGMADSPQARIKGTGLGLPISQRIVEAHSGRILASSAPEQGAVFTVTLPKHHSEIQTVTLDDTNTTIQVFQNAHILVVEDEPDIQVVLKEILESHGYIARITDDGHTALSLCMHEAISAALVDVFMPKMNGEQFVEHIRKLPAINRPAVVMITGSDTEADPERCAQLGICEVIQKPFAPQQVLQALFRAITKRQVSLR